MKIKKMICAATLILSIFSSTQVHANSLNVQAYKQEKSNWCWAATSQSIVNYVMGSSHSQSDIVTRVLGSPLNETVDIFKDFDAIYDFVYTNAYNDHYKPQIYLGSLPFYSIESQIDARNPIQVCITWKNADGSSTGSSHALDIFGYNASNNNVYYIDPWDGTKNIASYSYICNNSKFKWNYGIDSEIALSLSSDTKTNVTNKKIDNNDGVDNINDFSIKNIDNFKEDILLQKSDYNLNSNNSFNDIKLGDGIKYYSILPSNLNKNTNVISDNLLNCEGYIFPLKLNNKDIATVYVKYSNGKWIVNKISNAKISDKILKAKNNYKLKDYKLIIDNYTQIAGLLNSDVNNNYFISLNSDLNLSENQKIKTADLIKSISANLKLK